MTLKFESNLVQEQWTQIKNLRKEIYIKEQNLDPCLIEDKLDRDAMHIIIENDTQILASCRIYVKEETIYLERLCVHKDYRNLRLGTRILNFILDYAQTHQFPISIQAQYRLKDMYEKYGFIVISKPYYQYGCYHISMIKHI